MGRFLLLALGLLLPGSPALAQGVLKVDIITAYNLIVDSNVQSPPTYAPRSGYIGAQICNTGNTALSNVVAYVGNYNGGSGSTPGIFPVQDTDTGTWPAHLTATGDYSLQISAGDTGTADATRYIGTLAANTCRVQYWLFTYPACVNVLDATGTRVWQEPPCDATITGGIAPTDDLTLYYDVWATTTSAITVPTVSKRRYFVMRNEISAAANKIWPNTTSKVPDAYLAAIQSVLGWGTLGPDGRPIEDTNAVYPGQRVITTQGIWYDLGNVVHGFDNDGNLVPDVNAWLQPVGDPTTFDAGCFRMVNVYGVVIAKLSSGGEVLIPFQNQLYFENLPDNTGVVGLVYYQYVATDGACSANMSPYQEAASGFDNEKFCGDYGLSLGLISKGFGGTFAFSKTDSSSSVTPGSNVTYTATATNNTHNVDYDGGTCSTGTEPCGVNIGAPDLGVPITFSDAIPAGTTFRGSAFTTLTPPSGTGTYYQGFTDADGNYETCEVRYSLDAGDGGSSSFVTWYSTDNGTSWTFTEPAAASVTNIRWMLVTVMAYGGGHDGNACRTFTGYNVGTIQTSLPIAKTATIAYQVTVSNPYTGGAVMCNSMQAGIGPAATSTISQDCDLVTGSNSIAGTVFKDNGVGTGGVFGNGTQDGTEAGIGNASSPSVKVDLYYDGNNNGVLDVRTLSAIVTTSGDATLTSAAGSFRSTDVGREISGVGIPSGATITSFTDTGSVEISANATATGSGYVVVGPVTTSTTRTITSVTRTNASTTLTATSNVFSSSDVGALITGTGIQAGTRIASYTSATSVTLTKAATSSGSAQAVIDSGRDIYYGTTVTSSTGTYSFSSLPDGPFIVVVKKWDGNETGDSTANAATDTAFSTNGWGNTTVDPSLSLTSAGDTAPWPLEMNETATVVTMAVNLDYAQDDATARAATNVNFGFAPPFELTKTVPNSTVDEGDVFNYTITLRNRLPSVGRQGPTGCEYTVWAPTTSTDSQTSKQFTDIANAAGSAGPDGKVASALVTGGGLRTATGTGFSLADQAGTITKVEALFFGYFGTALTDDQLNLCGSYNGTSFSSPGSCNSPYTLTTALIDSYVGAPASYDPNNAVSWEITSQRTWSFASDDFSLLSFTINPSKTANADQKYFYLDAIGLRITTDTACEAAASTTLDPVPLQDQYDKARFTYISSSPAADTVDTTNGLLQWTNVGPLTPGSSTSVTVTVQTGDVAGLISGTCATLPPPDSSQCNYAKTEYTASSVDYDVKYSDGRLANNDEDSVLVNVQGKGEMRGVVWNDLDNDGWQGTTGYETRTFSMTTNGTTTVTSSANFVATDVGALISGTGIPSGAYITAFNSTSNVTISAAATDSTSTNRTLTEPGLPNVSVTLFACVDSTSSTGALVTNSTAKTCTDNSLNGVWTALKTTTTDSSGAYEFIGLDEGFFVVQVGDTDSTVTTSGTAPFSKTQTAEPGGSAANTSEAITAVTAPTYRATGTTGSCQNSNSPSGIRCDSTWGSSADNTDNLNTLNQPAAEEEVTTINFGYYSNTSTLYGNVWWDINGDATRDTEDSDLSGFTVTLSGTSTGSATTDSYGNYSFSGLATSGTWTITITPPTLLNQVWTETVETSPVSVGSLDNAITVTLSAAQMSGSHDFGYTLATTADIGDTVYYDLDADGHKDAGETGISGVTVWLYEDVDRDGTIDDGIDTLQATDVTDTNGNYLFENYASGSYIVKVDTSTLPDDVTATGDPDLGSGAIGDFIWFDTNANGSATKTATTCTTTISSTTVTCPSNSFASTDLGSFISGTNIPSGTRITAVTGTTTVTLSAAATASGTSNQTLTITEQGIPNVVVKLYADADADNVLDAGEQTAVAATVTDVNGNYLFTGLLAGKYFVDIVDGTLPSGLTLRSTDPQTSVVTLATDSSTDLTKDAGYSSTSNSALGGRVWHDVDNDGRQDTGESGIGSVYVTLTQSASSGGSCYTTSPCVLTTDADGSWFQSGLTSGRAYTVTVRSYSATLSNDLPRDFTASTGSTNGASVTMGSADYTGYDLGFYYTGSGSSPTGTISGRVFQDNNNDRTYTGGTDTAITSTTVNLLNENNEIVATTTSGASDGTYSFTGVFVGEYSVQAVDELGTRYSVLFLNAGSSFPNLNVIYDEDDETTVDSQSSVSIDGVYGDLLQDFGYRVLTGTIGDTVYLDANENGTQDIGEPGISGVTVRLLTWTDADSDGLVDSTASCPASGTDGELVFQSSTTTSSDDVTTAQDEGGKYLFTNLSTPATGTLYMACVVTSTLPGTARLTADPDTDGDPCSHAFFAVTASNTTLTSSLNPFLPSDVGYTVTGSNIPAGTRIVAYNNAGSVTMSAAATSSTSGTYTLTYTSSRTVSATTTSGSPNVTSSAEFLASDVAYTVSGTGIAAGTLVSRFNTTSSITLSADATASGTNTLTFTSQSCDSRDVVVGLPGAGFTGSTNYLAADFGYALSGVSGYGRFGDYLWIDQDGDGLKDAGESGIARITVWVDGNGTDQTGDGIIDGDGDGVFDGTDTNSDGTWDSRAVTITTVNGSTTVTSSGAFVSADVGRNIGGTGTNIPAGTTITAFTNVNTVTISASATGAGTSTATVYEGERWTETDSTGFYLFSSLPDGTYSNVKVRTTDTDFPSGLTNTYVVRTTNDGNLTSTVPSVVVASSVVTTISDGDVDTTDTCTSCDLDVDFGYRYSGTRTLSGTICTETTKDGYCGDNDTDTSGVGTGEVAQGGITVYLYRWTDAGTANTAWPTRSVSVTTNTTSGTEKIATSSSAFLTTDAGMGISGTGIASGTRISAVGSTSQITLDTNATAAGTNTLTIASGVADSSDTFTLLGSTITDANGDYSFANVPDNVVVVWTIPDSRVLRLVTTQTGGSYPTSVANATSRQLHETTSAYSGDGGTTFNTVTTVVKQALTLTGNATDLDFSLDPTLNGTLTYDYGDLPDPTAGGGTDYNMTLVASNGANHRIGSVYLGANVAADSDGDGTSATAAAHGDDNGVSLESTSFYQDGAGAVRVQVGPVGGTMSGWLTGFIDWNGDGDFDDTDEQVIDDAVSTAYYVNNYNYQAGQNYQVVSFAVPDFVATGSQTFFARFRIYPSEPLLKSPTGAALDGSFSPVVGEVEDYLMTVTVTEALLTSFSAREVGGAVAVEWETGSETGTVGFLLNRWDDRQQGWVQASERLLPGLLVSPQGGSYRFIDPAAIPGQTYRYQLLEVEASGRRKLLGTFDVNTSSAPDARARRAAQRLGEDTPAGGYQRVARQPRARAAAITKPPIRPQTPAPAGKIAVREAGVQFISLDTMIRAGVDLPSAVLQRTNYSLTNLGEPVPLWPSEDNSGFYFYGEGLDSTYTNDNVYWFGETHSRTLRMKTRNDRPASGQATGTETYRRTLHLEQDNLPAPGLFTSSDDDWWMWQFAFSGTGPVSLPFQVQGASHTGEATLAVRLKGGTDTEADPDHHVVVRVNGHFVADATFQGLEVVEARGTLDASWLVEGENTLEVENLADTAAPYSLIYVDSADLQFESGFRAASDRITASSGDNGVLRLSGFTRSDIIVFDVTDPRDPVLVKGALAPVGDGTFGVTLAPPNRETVYHALTPNAIPAALVSPDAASSLKNTANAAQYLVITAAELMSTAQTLAAYRTDLSSKVVDIEDVYDEFGYGVRTPKALREFLAYTRQNWQTPPRYVVLAGDGSWDYKDKLGLGGNVIPTMMIGTPHGLFPSDVWYADVDGGGPAPYAAIGRLPVNTPQDLARQIAKIKVREGAAGSPWLRNSLLVADNRDDGGDFPADSEKVAARIPASYSKSRVYLSSLLIDDARNQLLGAINAGAGSVNYLGHGGYNLLADEGLLYNEDVDTFTNAQRPTVVTAMTCLSGNFALPFLPSLGETLLRKDAGGAAAVWAPSGLSRNEYAGFLASAYYEAATGGLSPRIGDAVNSSLRQYSQFTPGPDYMVYVYNLLGDPAMKLY